MLQAALAVNAAANAADSRDTVSPLVVFRSKDPMDSIKETVKTIIVWGLLMPCLIWLILNIEAMIILAIFDDCLFTINKYSFIG